MNGKQAKRLRKAVKLLGLPEKSIYKEGKDSLWGSFPYIENTVLVDGKKLNKVLNKAKNPKVKTILNGSHWYRKYLRYFPGKPIKLELCERQVYQQMKKKLMVS